MTAAQDSLSPGSIGAAFLRWLDPIGTHNLVALHPETGMPEARTFAAQDYADIAPWVDARAGHLNIYYTANEVRSDLGSRKPSKADIVAVRAIYTDVDPMPSFDLEAERARIVAKLRTDAPLPFAAVIDSGGGFQALAVLADKLPAAPETVEWAETHGRGLAQALGADSVQNVDRLLRLPGPDNLPGASKRAKGRVRRAAAVIDLADNRTTRDAISRQVVPADRPAGDDTDGDVIEAITDITHSGYDCADTYADLSDDLKARFDADLARDTALAKLWHTGAVGSDDKSGSALRFKLAGTLKRLGGYDADAYASLAWIWPLAVQAGDDRAGKLTPRQLGRDWGRAKSAGTGQSDITDAFKPEPGPSAAIRPSPFIMRDPAQIPPRQWLYGRHLIRGFVSLTVAPGGLGKSSLLVAEMLAMAAGRPLLGDSPAHPLRVWLWNGEDPSEELQRRIQATCLNFGIEATDLGDRLLVDSGRDLPISIASTGKDGTTIAQPLVSALVEAIKEAEIDVLVIDPFVTSHSVPENDTTAMNAVVAEWRKIADLTGCAIELVHHVNKAAAMSTDAAGIYGSRGAGALIDGVRSARYLSRMSVEEGNRLGVDRPERFFRVEMGKANLAPIGTASWRRMVGIPLHNGAGYWPEGDVIGVCTPWAPPDASEGVTEDHVQRLLERIAAKPDGARKDSQAADWVGYDIADVLGLDAGPGKKQTDRSAAQKEARAKVTQLLEQWVRDRTLIVEARPHPKKPETSFQVVVCGETMLGGIFG